MDGWKSNGLKSLLMWWLASGFWFLVSFGLVSGVSLGGRFISISIHIYTNFSSFLLFSFVFFSFLHFTFLLFVLMTFTPFCFYPRAFYSSLFYGDVLLFSRMNYIEGSTHGESFATTI